MGEQLITDIILLIVIISEKDALTNIIVQNHCYDVCGIFKVDQVKSPQNPHNEGKHYLFTLCNYPLEPYSAPLVTSYCRLHRKEFLCA